MRIKSTQLYHLINLTLLEFASGGRLRASHNNRLSSSFTWFIFFFFKFLYKGPPMINRPSIELPSRSNDGLDHKNPMVGPIKSINGAINYKSKPLKT